MACYYREEPFVQLGQIEWKKHFTFGNETKITKQEPIYKGKCQKRKGTNKWRCYSKEKCNFRQQQPRELINSFRMWQVIGEGERGLGREQDNLNVD